jgi:hypothetical protein
MKTSTPSNWIERLEELHPLLKAPPRPMSEWAARNVEIDAAIKADAEAARRTRDEAARRMEGDYHNQATAWAKIAIGLVITVTWLFITCWLI